MLLAAPTRCGHHKIALKANGLVITFFPSSQSLLVYDAWHGSGVPVEYHTYFVAQHGFGAIPTGHSSDAWMDAMFAFMRDVKFLE